MKARATPTAVSRHARWLLIGATLFWGASFPLLRSLQLAQHHAGVSDAVMACADTVVRFGLAAFVLLLIHGRDLRRGVTAREWSQALGLGVLAGAGLYLQTLGLIWTDVSISSFLTQLYMLIVPLLVALRDRRLPTLRIVLACGLVLLGAALLSPGLLTHFVLGPGEIVTLASTVFFAGQILWIERPVYARNRPGVVTLLMFATIAVIFAAAYPLAGGTRQAGALLFSRPAAVGLMLSIVFFCTVISFFLMNAWQRFISATEAGLIYCLEPVVASFLAVFLPGWISTWAGIDYPNESLHWGLLVGGGFILAATFLGVTGRRG
jgi:drug/metabolite transporter (DMT)-like permease